MSEIGLRAGDLANLVEPLCAVDKLIPKLDEDNIVVTFFVGRSNEDAAYDLSSFIEKGPIDSITDTEVSETPNADGFYEVYVEFPRNNRFPEDFLQLLRDVCKLTGQRLSDWEFEPFPYEKSKIDKHGVAVLKSISSPVALKEFFSSSNTPIDFYGNIIKVNEEDWFLCEEVEKSELEQSPLFESHVASLIENLLGEDYDVASTKKSYILENKQTGKLLRIEHYEP